jgi:hypothetical protein
MACKLFNPVKMGSLGLSLIVNGPGFTTCQKRMDVGYPSLAYRKKTTTYHPSQEVKEHIFWYSFISRSENLVRGSIIINTFIHCVIAGKKQHVQTF